jgi:hypothetical protein
VATDIPLILIAPCGMNCGIWHTENRVSFVGYDHLPNDRKKKKN